jgi:lipocalin
MLRKLEWQEFEERTREILEKHGFKTKKVVFRDEHGRAEIDVVAERFDLTLAIDAKRYAGQWYRISALKKESEKHAEKCRRYEKLVGKRIIPIVVSLIDDRILFHGSIVVPFDNLNEFLLDLHRYLAEIWY